MPSPLRAIRRFVEANEDSRRFYYGIRVPRVQEEMNKTYERLYKKPRPHNKNTAMKLKFTHLRTKTPNTRQRLSQKNTNQGYIRAQKNIRNVYGYGVIGPYQAHKIIELAEYRAARAIAKALASSPIIRRVEGRRRARNFIREELGLYRRPNSTVRPSNVKARRITF